MNISDLIFTQVESSQIDSVAHDTTSNILYVKFKNKSVYEYQNVPAAMFQQLLSAESVGKFFSSTIKKDPVAYPYKPV